MRYLLCLLAAICFELLAKLLSPVLPLFAKPRYGLVDNSARCDIEPRLPTWLAWFDTPDNSLWGDTGWRTIHCVKHWNTYLGMALWLWRNTATGFSRSVLARPVWLSDIRYKGDPKTSHKKPYGAFFATTGKVWQFKLAKPIPYTGWVIQLNYGWQMNHMLESQIEFDGQCHFKMSTKLKRA